MNDDIIYIAQFLGGEGQGFDMLVKKYQNRVLNIVYSLIGQDRESEDIAQEVFLKVYHNLSSFKQHSKFSTWLYRITVNTAYDFLRKRKNIVSTDKVIEEKENNPENYYDRLIARERKTIVQKAIERVPLKYRTAVILKDIEGLSYIEISDVLHCSIGTVESRIYRARQALKEELLKLEGGAL
jgi:RNA polymerase sigma-70 factor (ECF subfamily)